MDPRTQAAKVLGQLLAQKGSLATLLPSASTLVAEKERPLLQELCYGTCRWHPRLQGFLQLLVEKPLRAKDRDIQALLLLGLYQLIYLRIPDHAALSSTVESAQALKKPWAKKLVNGVLRRFVREREQLEKQLAADPTSNTAHPLWLLQEITTAWPNHYLTIVEQNNQPPPFTIRVNQQAMTRDDYLQRLLEQNLDAAKTTTSSVGITLKRPTAVDQLPGFDRGWVSVQDESPQLSAELLRCEKHHRVLDACSAPGGKTAHLLEQQPDLSLLALDISARRLQRTRENLQRLGLRAELKVGDATEPDTWWDGQPFDRILLDAPCSASGIIRRQPDIKILRSAESLTTLVHTQQQLLRALWPLLKTGGELLYATCSILPQENHQLVETFLQENSDANHSSIDVTWGIDLPVGRQLLPQANGGDGFYYARLLKN